VLTLRADRIATLCLFHPLQRLAQRPMKKIPVLMYHSISEHDNRNLHPYYETATTPEVFAEHIKFLHENNYRIVSLPELVAILAADRYRQRARRLTAAAVPPEVRANDRYARASCREATRQAAPHKCVAITFDDGFQDFYWQAFPVLNSYGYQATVFLPTAFIGKRPLRFKGACCLTWSQVRELQKAGVSFGSHTVNHPKLTDLTAKKLDDELRQSKLAIEDHLGCAVESFAYPYAFPSAHRSFTLTLRRLLEDAGYRNGVSTMVGRVGARDDCFFMKRLPVNTHDDWNLFRAKLEGGYDWIYPPQLLWKKLTRKSSNDNSPVQHCCDPLTDCAMTNNSGQ
jgi:peptidoglycan/xylan/chitin deacetylase (PgdA/CDA1 family)